MLQWGGYPCRGSARFIPDDEIIFQKSQTYILIKLWINCYIAKSPTDASQQHRQFNSMCCVYRMYVWVGERYEKNEIWETVTCSNRERQLYCMSNIENQHWLLYKTTAQMHKMSSFIYCKNFMVKGGMPVDCRGHWYTPAASLHFQGLSWKSRPACPHETKCIVVL